MNSHQHDNNQTPPAERPLSRITLAVLIAGGLYAGALIVAARAHHISWLEAGAAYLAVAALVAWFALRDLRPHDDE